MPFFGDGDKAARFVNFLKGIDFSEKMRLSQRKNRHIQYDKTCMRTGKK